MNKNCWVLGRKTVEEIRMYYNQVGASRFSSGMRKNILPKKLLRLKWGNFMNFRDFFFYSCLSKSMKIFYGNKVLSGLKRLEDSRDPVRFCSLWKFEVFVKKPQKKCVNPIFDSKWAKTQRDQTNLAPILRFPENLRFFILQ